MEQPDTDLLKAQLIQKKGKWPGISKRSGMSHSWLWQFANNKIPNPGIRSLKKLEAALREAA